MSATSEATCTAVVEGYWAPMGSSEPIECPESGFYCPGKAQDETYGGAQPVASPTGGLTDMVEVQTVQKDITLDLTCADFDINTVKQTLATRYGVDVALITLSNPCARRRELGASAEMSAARSGRMLQSSQLSFTVTVATEAVATDGTTVTAALADVVNTVSNTNDAALGTSLGVALTGSAVTASSTAPSQAAVQQARSSTCPKGKWCTGGAEIECVAGTYQPNEGAASQSDCLDCPALSSSPAGSAEATDCVCRDGFTSITDALGAMQCECDAGSQLFYSITCVACDVGWYKPNAGNTLCLECPEGKTTAAAGSVGADECRAGLQQTCEPGTEEQAGTGDCVPCRKGHYCTGGLSIKCKDGYWSNVTGAMNTSSCIECPFRGVTCQTGDRIEIQKGYFMDLASANSLEPQSYECPRPLACAGGFTAYGEESCAPGHKGKLCGACEDNYYRGRFSCLSCSDLAVDEASVRDSSSRTVTLMATMGSLTILVIAAYLLLPRWEAASVRLSDTSWAKALTRPDEGTELTNEALKVALQDKLEAASVRKQDGPLETLEGKAPPLAIESGMLHLTSAELRTLGVEELDDQAWIELEPDLFFQLNLTGEEPKKSRVEKLVLTAAAIASFVGKTVTRVTGHNFPAIVAGLSKITLSFMQCIGAINRFGKLKWPQLFIDFMKLLDSLNLEFFSVVPAECVTGSRLGFFFELATTLGMPIIFIFLTMSILWIIRVLQRTFSLPKARRSFKAVVFYDSSWSIVQDWNQPRMYVLMTWCFLFLYPSIARKSIVTFGCVDAGVQADGGRLFLLRDDPAIECYTANHNMAMAFAAASVAIYCLGIPLLVIVFTGRWRANEDTAPRVALLTMTYDDDYYYGEAISLLYKLFFTGVIHVIAPDTRWQIWAGALVSFFCFVAFLLTKPLRHDLCDYVAMASLLSILLTYLSAFLCFQDTTETVLLDDYLVGVVLVAVNCLCFIVLIVWLVINGYRSVTGQLADKLRYTKTHEPVAVERIYKNKFNDHPGIENAPGFHLFLSHAWPLGQDVMKLVKQRVMKMLPTAKVFLDVDDLRTGSGTTEVDHSDVVLVYAMPSYFQKINCVKELFRAVLRQKAILTFVCNAADTANMMTEANIREVITEEWVDYWATKRGLSKKVAGWGEEWELEKLKQKELDDRRLSHPLTVPTAAMILERLFERPVIQWQNLSALQDVTMRLICERMLPVDRPLRHQQLYLPGEAGRKKIRLRPPHKIVVKDTLGLHWQQVANRPASGREIFHDLLSATLAAGYKTHMDKTSMYSLEFERAKFDSLGVIRGLQFGCFIKAGEEWFTPVKGPGEKDPEAPGGGDGIKGKDKDGASDLIRLASTSTLRRPKVKQLKYHLYVSPYNLGADGVAMELESRLLPPLGRGKLKVTSDISNLELCELMLVYLNEQTWNSGSSSEAFGDEIFQATSAGIQILPVAEMPMGLDEKVPGREPNEALGMHWTRTATQPTRGVELDEDVDPVAELRKVLSVAPVTAGGRVTLSRDEYLRLRIAGHLRWNSYLRIGDAWFSVHDVALGRHWVRLLSVPPSGTSELQNDALASALQDSGLTGSDEGAVSFSMDELREMGLTPARLSWDETVIKVALEKGGDVWYRPVPRRNRYAAAFNDIMEATRGVDPDGDLGKIVYAKIAISLCVGAWRAPGISQTLQVMVDTTFKARVKGSARAKKRSKAQKKEDKSLKLLSGPGVSADQRASDSADKKPKGISGGAKALFGAARSKAGVCFKLQQGAGGSQASLAPFAGNILPTAEEDPHAGGSQALPSGHACPPPQGLHGISSQEVNVGIAEAAPACAPAEAHANISAGAGANEPPQVDFHESNAPYQGPLTSFGARLIGAPAGCLTPSQPEAPALNLTELVLPTDLVSPTQSNAVSPAGDNRNRTAGGGSLTA